MSEISLSNDLESLAHELVFAMEDMQAQRAALTARIERIALVVKSMESLLPSTRALAGCNADTSTGST